jgi:hypothetical protein
MNKEIMEKLRLMKEIDNLNGVITYMQPNKKQNFVLQYMKKIKNDLFAEAQEIAKKELQATQCTLESTVVDMDEKHKQVTIDDILTKHDTIGIKKVSI